MNKRIVVLVSGTGSNMEALVAACERGGVPGRVVAVLADRECPGIARAERAGVPASVVAPSSFADREEWNVALRERVASHDPDLVVNAGFMRILSPGFVDAFHGRQINLHPSLLPSFRGAHAVRDALVAGASETGASVHFVDRGVDTGPVVLQERVAILPGDDEATLHARIREVEHRLLPEACKLVLRGVVSMP